MKKKVIDTSGLSCPQPVVVTRQALKECGFEELEIIVDNSAAKENVTRFLTKSKVKLTRIETIDNKFHIFVMTKRSIESVDFNKNDYPCSVSQYKGKTIFITNDAIGSGNEELGQKLMKAFLYTLTELENQPTCLLFMNNGVKLCVEGSDSVPNLKTLSESRTQILVCGTCLDYFGISDKLQVGVISNMFDIAEHLLDDDRVLKI